MPTLRPTAPAERHHLLDVLRGFALLGVLLANMASHSGYIFIEMMGADPLPTAGIDHYVQWVEHFLIDGKFYSLFSMLFGIGFALQLKRSADLQTRFKPRFLRRLLVMFVLGLLHAILLYVGDILTVYAITGLFLLFYRNTSDKFILRSAFFLMLLPVLQYAIFWGIHLANGASIVDAGAVADPATGDPGVAFMKEVVRVYRSGTFAEIIQMNIGGLIIARYPDLLFTGRFFRVLAMFLVGFYITRHMIFAQVRINRPLIRKVLIWGAIIGVPCNIVLAIMMTSNAHYDFQPTGIIEPIVYAFGVPALCLFYAGAIALLFEQPGWKKILMIFKPVGQIALTNYIMQSVICVLIFMGYGLGHTATIGPAKLALIGLSIYAAQVLFSHIWVRYFRFGPLEWMWRSLTYGRRQPFLKRATAVDDLVDKQTDLPVAS